MAQGMDSGLRVNAHDFSEPFDRTYVGITDGDGDGSDSKIFLPDQMVQEY